MSEAQDLEFFDAFEREVIGETPDESARLREISDLCFVMRSREGERVLRRILGATRLYGLSYTRGDSHETAFREGMRRVGLWLLSEMGEADAGLCAEIVHQIGAHHGTEHHAGSDAKQR